MYHRANLRLTLIAVLTAVVAAVTAVAATPAQADELSRTGLRRLSDGVGEAKAGWCGARRDEILAPCS